MSKLAMGSILLSGAIVAIAVSTWMEAQADARVFEDTLTKAGFANVSLVSQTSTKATIMLHGCKLGLEKTDGNTRVVNGHETPPFNVNSVSDAGTWTGIPELGNKASSPDEVTKYLADHHEQHPCYK